MAPVKKDSIKPVKKPPKKTIPKTNNQLSSSSSSSNKTKLDSSNSKQQQPSSKKKKLNSFEEGVTHQVVDASSLSLSFDVLCERGGRANRTEGNSSFRGLSKSLCPLLRVIQQQSNKQKAAPNRLLVQTAFVEVVLARGTRFIEVRYFGFNFLLLNI